MRFENYLGDYLDRRASRVTSLIVSLLVALVVLRERSPLAWDEAVYAARAKDLSQTNFDWSTITSAYWSDLRAPGFPAFLGVAFEFVGASDFAARALVAAFSVALLALIASTLDLFNKPRVGTSAIAITIACPGFLATSTLAFADHPAAFFSVLALYFALRSYLRKTPTGLFMVPISLGIATTIRFGAAMFVAAPLGIIGLLVVVQYARTRNSRQLIAFLSTGALSVLVVGYLLTSKLLTRNASPLDAKDAQVAITGNSATNWIGDLKTILSPGPVDYGFNGAFWGWSYASIFTILALVAIIRLVIARRLLPIALVSIVSLTPVVLYGLTVRQFVTTYLSPEFALGAAMLAWAYWAASDAEIALPDPDLGKIPGTRERAHRLIFAAISVVYLATGVRTFVGVSNMHKRLQGFEQVRAASVIANDVLGEECRLFTTRVPQAAWYSDCKVVGFSSGLVPEEAATARKDQINDYVAQQAARTSITDKIDVLGFLILEGAGNQPSIDVVWPERDPDQSVILSSPTGRRVALIGMPLP